MSEVGEGEGEQGGREGGEGKIIQDGHHMNQCIKNRGIVFFFGVWC